MNYPKKLFVPKGVGELVYGAISMDERDPYWHLYDPTGDGEHTFCGMAWDEIDELSSFHGIKFTNKEYGFCDCLYCIQAIITLKQTLKKLKEVAE